MAAEGKVAAIMQPYFFPYLGYWQLMSMADVFVILDSVKYIKGSWINRNFVLGSGDKMLISVPLEKASDSALIGSRQVSDVWNDARARALRGIRQTYAVSRYFDEIYPWLESQFSFPQKRFSKYLEHQIRSTAQLLSIETRIVIESDLGDFTSLERQRRIADISRAVGCENYLNLPGGRNLYSPDSFRTAGVRLGFLIPVLNVYSQGSRNFVPSLSIIDSLFWNGPSETAEMVRLGKAQWLEREAVGDAKT